MADQDFNIKVVTTADTRGIQQTSAELDKLKRQQAMFAEQARRQQATSAQTTPISGGGGGAGGLSGTAVGVGTIITVLSAAIGKWREFNAEQDRWVDGMIKAAAKAKELGDAIVEMQDKAISQRRTATEPLKDSYVRLSQELINLKTQQGLLNLPSQAEDWNNLQKKIQDVENQIKGVTDKLGGVPPPPTVPGPKAGKGESQALVDEAERNRKAAEEQLKEDVWEFDPETGGYKRSGKKQFPTFEPPPPPPPTNPPPKEDMIPKPVETGGATIDFDKMKQVIREAFEQGMLRYWGP